MSLWTGFPLSWRKPPEVREYYVTGPKKNINPEEADWLDLAGKMVAYLCPGCGTQGTQLVAAPAGDRPPVVCPACGNRVMSRELASSREERSSVEV